MKKRQHKWFRNQRYKMKLEHDVGNHRTYYSNVYFTTKEPDYEIVNRNFCECRSWQTDEARWKSLTTPYPGRDYFVYYERPAIPYSVRRYYKRAGRSQHQKFLKRKTNRKVRRDFKQYGEIYQHNEYRRTTEFWWELD